MADSFSCMYIIFQWNLYFFSDVHDWEVVVVYAFFRKLYNLKIVQGREDSLLWVCVGNSRFSVS